MRLSKINAPMAFETLALALALVTIRCAVTDPINTKKCTGLLLYRTLAVATGGQTPTRRKNKLTNAKQTKAMKKAGKAAKKAATVKRKPSQVLKKVIKVRRRRRANWI